MGLLYVETAIMELSALQGAIVAKDVTRLGDAFAAASSGFGGLGGGLGGALGSLAAFANPIVENIWYQDKAINLDGIQFVRCRFDRCTLYVNTTQISLTECFISQDSKLIYSADNSRIITLFFARIPASDDIWPEFKPQRHENGSVTIK